MPFCIVFTIRKENISLNSAWATILDRVKGSKVLAADHLHPKEDLGLNKMKFSWSPLWMLLHWSDPP